MYTPDEVQQADLNPTGSRCVYLHRNMLGTVSVVAAEPRLQAKEEMGPWVVE